MTVELRSQEAAIGLSSITNDKEAASLWEFVTVQNIGSS